MMVLLLKNIDDLLAKYESALCLKSIVKQEQLKLNYFQIIEDVAPIIIDLFKNFFSPNILWPLIQLLTTLIEKSQYVCSDNIIKFIENPSLNILMQNDSELIRGALIDMLKNLIVSFPYESKITSIYVICLNFIDIVFSQVKILLFLNFINGFNLERKC